MLSRFRMTCSAGATHQRQPGAIEVRGNVSGRPALQSMSKTCSTSILKHRLATRREDLISQDALVLSGRPDLNEYSHRVYLIWMKILAPDDMLRCRLDRCLLLHGIDSCQKIIRLCGCPLLAIRNAEISSARRASRRHHHSSMRQRGSRRYRAENQATQEEKRPSISYQPERRSDAHVRLCS